MFNLIMKGDTMKEELRSVEEIEPDETLTPDIDADDAKASGMLGKIGRVEAGSDEKKEPAARSSRAANPFLLESLYFRSFDERGLLTREEETAIAKQVDHGTRRIRVALQEAVKTLSGLKRTPLLTETMRTLQLVKRLSGLSATALAKAETALLTVLKTPDSGLKLTTALYYTPSGRSIQAEGIEPDFKVPLQDAEKERVIVKLRDTLEKSRKLG